MKTIVLLVFWSLSYVKVEWWQKDMVEVAFVILQFSISDGLISILLLLNAKYSINLFYKINIVAIWQQIQQK